MNRTERGLPVDGQRQSFEGRMQLSAEYVKSACPVLLNLENVAPALRSSVCTLSADFARTEIGQLVETILRQPIEIILIKGLPGAGKTRVLRELTRLFTFLGFDANVSQYDQVLQALVPLFGPDTDRYDENKWYFVSHLLLVSIFHPQEINLADPLMLERIYQNLQRTTGDRVNQELIAQMFINAPLPERKGRRRIVLLEAPAVATVYGKDRGRIAEQILGERERHLQTKGQLGCQLTVSIVPHLATMQHAITERNIAAEVEAIMDGQEADPFILHTLDPYLQRLQAMNISPITSTNYLEDLRRWIAEQRAAAPESFIKSMYAEEVARVKAWYQSDKAKHRIMRNEVVLPQQMIDTLKPAEIKVARTMAACYEDETLRIGIHPTHAHVVTNKYNRHILSR